jgi:hypothetical protein
VGWERGVAQEKECNRDVFVWFRKEVLPRTNVAELALSPGESHPPNHNLESTSTVY